MDILKRDRKNRIKNTRWNIVDNMFVSLLITGAIIEVADVGAGFIDGLVIARFLGPDAMAAEGIAHPIFSIIGVASGLIAVGMQVKCSQLIGRGNVKRLNDFFSISVYAGLIISIFIGISLFLFPKPFAYVLGATENGASLLTPAADYIRGLGIGAPMLIMIAILGPALQLDGSKSLIRTGALISSVTDIVLDLAAVKLGFGMLGVGVATSIGSLFNVIYLCRHFTKKNRMLHLVKPSVTLKEFLNMISNGTEKALRRLANIIRPLFLNNIIIAYAGTVGMTALSIRNNFCNFTEIFASGIAAAVALLTGLYYGEANEEAIAEVKRCEWKYTAIFSTIICVILLVFAKPIARIYILEEGETMDLVVFVIRMLALQGPMQTLIKSRISYLQVIYRKVNMNLLIFASQLVIVIISAFVLGNLFGAYGILASYTVSDALSLICVLIFYEIKHKKIKIGMKELLNLPDEYYYHAGNVISLDIRNIDDVASASDMIMMFAKGHKYDEKTGYYAALAFEEIASNIIEHGFPTNKKKDPIIDLRVVAMEHKLIIRIRDDCKQFDITKKIAEVVENDTDPMAGLGIRITSNIAKNIEYTSAFETNNIIITYDV